MNRNRSLASLAAIAVAALVLLLPAAAENGSSDARPRYGGTLNVATHVRALNPLSWDPADWNWKQNHDTGMYFEQLGFRFYPLKTRRK